MLYNNNNNHNMDQSGYSDLKNESTISSDSLIVGILILPNLDANSIPFIDSDNTLSDIVLNDGELIIGDTDNAPVASTLTGTADEIIVTNGPGSITLSLPQTIAPTSDPTFNNLTVNTINGKIGNDLVTGPASALADRLVSFDGTTGKIIKDSNILATDIFLRTGTVAMTGNINMNNNELQYVKAIRPNTASLVIGNTTTTPVSSNGTITIGDFTTSTGDNSICIGLQNIARPNSIAIGKETISGTSATIVGYRSSCGTNTDTIIVGHDNVSSGGANADIFGVNRTNSQANSLLLGNGSYVNIRANSTCDLGTSAIPFQSMYSNASLIGTTNSRLVNDIVSNTSTGVAGNLPSFVSSKVIGDTGITAASITGGPFLPLAGGTMTASAIVNSNNGSITNLTTINTKTTNDLVTSAANGSVNMVATYAGTSKDIQSSGTLISDLATVTAMNLRVPYTGASSNVNLGLYTLATPTIINSFTDADKLLMVGTTNGAKIAHSFGYVVDNHSGVFTAAGGNINTGSFRWLAVDDTGAAWRTLMTLSNSGVLTPTSNLLMGANSISGSTNSRAADNILSCTTNPTYGNLPMWSLTNKVLENSGLSSFNVVTGPASATDGNLASYNFTTGKIIKDSGILSTNVVLGPASSISGRVTTFNGTTGKLIQDGGTLLSDLATKALYVPYTGATGTLAMGTNAITGSGANTAGSLVLSSTVDATSTSSGSFQTLGGLAVAKQARIGGKVTISTAASATGLDLATADSYSNLRVIQNTTGSTDKHLYIGFNSGATSSVYLYSNNIQTLLVENNNVGIGMTPAIGGGNTNNLHIANGAGPTTIPTAGGALYVNAGRLFYRGGATGTVTQLAVG